MSSPTAQAAVERLVVYVHVPDVQASLEFYAKLGFRADSVMRGEDGVAFWASANSCSSGLGTGAEIMFARADAPIDPTVQAVIFYMYSRDVRALREQLLASGLHDGGKYCGQGGPNGGRCVAFELYHPPHMAAGELRVADPDGYCILIGQLEA